jgi:hypothetical protein
VDESAPGSVFLYVQPRSPGRVQSKIEQIRKTFDHDLDEAIATRRARAR